MKKFFSEYILLILLGGIFCWLLFIKLGSHPLINWDESIYAQVAKESLNNPLAFSYFNNPWMEKPPLIIWLTQLSFLIFGTTEFAARFFMPFFAGATLIFSSLSAKNFFKSELAGTLTAASFFLASQFMFSAFFLNLNLPVAFFYALCLWSISKISENKNYWYLFWIGIALGVMTKSVIGLLPLGLLIIPPLKTLREISFIRATLLALIIILPWHVIQTIQYGKDFWDMYVGYHLLERFNQGIENNGAPFWFYLDIFKTDYLLSFLTIFGILLFLLKSRGWNTYLKILINLFGIFIFFSYAGTKGYNYLIIIYPLLLMIISVSLVELFHVVKHTNLAIITTVFLIPIFLFQGLSYNKFKLYKWSGRSEYTDNKIIAGFAKPRKEKIYSTSLTLAGPAIWYYLGNKTEIINKFNYSQSQIVLHTPSKNVYLLHDKLIISE